MKTRSLVWLIVLCSLGGLSLLCIGGAAIYYALPSTPIELSFRDSAVGEGYVAQFINTSDRHLDVRVRFQNLTSGNTLERMLSIGGRQTLEVGWAEGWRFTAGEHVQVDLAGHRSKSWVVP